MAIRFAVLLVLLGVQAARAYGDPHEAARRLMLEHAGAFGLEGGIAVPIALADVSTPPASGVVPEEALVNYAYSDMVDRMEKMSRTVIGRDKKKRRVNTGVTPADRVDRGEIKHIVIHASMGATGKPGACEGSVSWLLSQKSASHFMVCRDGRVFRMVGIENIANHVKNSEIDRTSVGIETESGQPSKPGQRPKFGADDWAPESYWRMYASMAWLMRAIAKETNLARDREHIITHKESDRGLHDAHTDPGPVFESASYPEFEKRFPGEGVTPREFLMRLVNDDAPPQIWMVSAAGAGDEVEIKDTNSLGLAHIRVWKLDAAGKPSILIQDWSAPAAGMPPVSLKVPVPAEPGAYRVVARDLVGNTSAGLVKVPEPAQGGELVASELKLSLLAD